MSVQKCLKTFLFIVEPILQMSLISLNFLKEFYWLQESYKLLYLYPSKDSLNFALRFLTRFIPIEIWILSNNLLSLVNKIKIQNENLIVNLWKSMRFWTPCVCQELEQFHVM